MLGLGQGLKALNEIPGMWFSSMVVCKFSAEDNKTLHNGTYAQQ